MTKDYFISLANYNLWANQAVCSWLEKISDEQWNQPIISSFSSIRETVLHLCSAESIWAERMSKTKLSPAISSAFKGSKAEHIALLMNSSDSLKTFIEAFPENELSSALHFRRLNGEENTMPYFQMLAHVFNHSTYHRGQLVTMLRQVGFTAVGSTDLSVYFRSVSTGANSN